MTKKKPKSRPTGMPLGDAWLSWELALRARNRADGTIKEYRGTVGLFETWRDENDLPDDVEAVTAEEIRMFLIEERERTSAGNAHKHFRNLRAFFLWLIKEGERAYPSPVRTDDQPKVAEVERLQLTDVQILALFDTCKGAAHDDRRDLAILRLLIDSGPRVSGVAGMMKTDVMLADYRVRITLKGGDEILVPIGKKTAQALDRYLRVRSKHPKARARGPEPADDGLWLGRMGQLTAFGVYQMVRRRGEMIGFPELHPHMFRRASATRFRNAGGSEIEAMHVYGWKSPEMVRRYTRETERDRAREAHGRLSPGDRL